MTVQQLIMPKLGVYTDDVLLAEWLVDEGQRVEAGTMVFELETEKATAEVEAETPGFVHRLVRAGETVPIGSPVALIADTREEYEKAAGVAREQAPAPSPRGNGPLVSPRASALLQHLGYKLEDAREIVPTGPGGRIVDRDVTDWVTSRGAGTAAAGAPAGLTVRETIPLRGRRGTIAKRLVSSLQTAAQLTSVLELDVKPLVELRAELNRDRPPPRIGVTAVLLKLVGAALRAHPLLNARVTETAVELLDEINVAIAIETDDGLVAPVVHGVDLLSIEQINARVDELARRSRAGKLSTEDIADGTFTISNGGIHPVDLTTAILNPPQTGILWVGRIRDRPVVVGEGAIVARPTLQACLTFDHRAVDGGPAAAFLGTLERLVADLPSIPS